ncbi:MAG: putative lipid II flippase FtsW [Deltaproteobacteria bacterium]|nr:putative lipid II flippase FtsW [Deltaproteobacteria bacterium]
MRAAVGSGPVSVAKPRPRWLAWLGPQKMNAPWTQWVRGGGPSRGPDRILCGAVLCLCAVGVVMVFSAGAMFAAKRYGDWTFFLKREVMYAGLGVAAFAIALRTDYVLYRRLTYPMLFGSVALLVAVLIIGSRAGGAIRWFRLGPLSFQPSEVAKFALVVYLAALLARKAEKVKQLWVGFLPPLIVTAILMALLLKQPDLGTAAIFGFVALAMLFVAGTRTSYIILSMLMAAPVVYKLIVGTPWRMRRMLAFLDPWAHRRGAGYQVVESQISIGSGGLFGQGLGEGRQKLFFLPEAHTDFILAVVGEELGFLGVLLVLLLFGVLIWRGFVAACRARDAFGAYLAFGLTSVFGMQALINMAVVMGLVPTKGLTLPFVSYGGSSMIVSMFAAGVLGNVSARNPEPRRGESVLAGWTLALWPWGRGAGNKRSDKAVKVVVETGKARRRRVPAATVEDMA